MTDAEKSAALRIFAASCQRLETIARRRYPDLSEGQISDYVRWAMVQRYKHRESDLLSAGAKDVEDVVGTAIADIIMYPHMWP